MARDGASMPGLPRVTEITFGGSRAMTRHMAARLLQAVQPRTQPRDTPANMKKPSAPGPLRFAAQRMLIDGPRLTQPSVASRPRLRAVPQHAENSARATENGRHAPHGGALLATSLPQDGQCECNCRGTGYQPPDLFRRLRTEGVTFEQVLTEARKRLLSNICAAAA